jgi:hypothetical protein
LSKWYKIDGFRWVDGTFSILSFIHSFPESVQHACPLGQWKLDRDLYGRSTHKWSNFPVYWIPNCPLHRQILTSSPWSRTRTIVVRTQLIKLPYRHITVTVRDSRTIYIPGHSIPAEIVTLDKVSRGLIIPATDIPSYFYPRTKK